MDNEMDEKIIEQIYYKHKKKYPLFKRYNKLLGTVIRESLEEQRRLIYIDLTDCWASQRKDYDEHICNNQDGDDISFTKKTLENVFRLKHIGAEIEMIK